MASLTAILTAMLILCPLATSSPTAANTTNTTTSASSSDEPTAYDLLQDFDFPIGLLPQGIKSYSLDKGNGKFHATWQGPCSFSLEGSYELKYKSTITGFISKGRLTQLTGVSVKILFLWLNIVEVVRRGDDIEFSVGIASASFPIDNFFVCPQCGCGLDCDDVGRIRKLKFKVNSNANPSF